MNTPTQEQFQTVINNLKKAALKAKKANELPFVNMGNGHVDNTCGSAMCHGGWYAIVKGIDGFIGGAYAIAKDLGFKKDTDLERWAGDNPEIWGNENGTAMFYSDDAFLNGHHQIEDLQQIIDHWEQVKQRAAKLSN